MFLQIEEDCSLAHTVHDERAAAPVLVFTCSDHRLHRSRSVAVLEEYIDRLGAEYGLIESGEEVEFDLISIPGPQQQLSNLDEKVTISLLHTWSDLLLNLHGGEVVILTYHVGHLEDGEVVDSGCGAEGENHMDGAGMRRKCVLASMLLQRRFPNHSFEIATLGVVGGRLAYVERVVVSNAERADVLDAFSFVVRTQESTTRTSTLPQCFDSISTTQRVTDRVMEIATEHFETRPLSDLSLTLDALLVEDLGADSLVIYDLDRKIEMAFTCEHGCGEPIKFTDGQVSTWRTIKDIVDMLVGMGATIRESPSTGSLSNID